MRTAEEDVFGSVEKVGNGAASKDKLEELLSIVEIKVYIFWLDACSISVLFLTVLV